MFYTTAGAAKQTGLGESTILRAIEEGRIAGVKDLFGDWQIHEQDLRALAGAPGQNAGQKLLENKSTSAANTPGGETPEIFGPLLSQFNNEQARHHASELVPSLIFLPSPTPKEVSYARGRPAHAPHKAACNEAPHRNADFPAGREDGLWLDDEDKIGGRVPNATRKWKQLPITGILLVALGWAGGVTSYHVLSAIFTSSNRSIAGEKQVRPAAVAKRPNADNTGKAAELPRSNPTAQPSRRRTVSKPMLEPDRETTGSIKQQDRVEQDRVLTPFPDTRPTTVIGWTLRSVSGGIAVLEGPYGTWRVARGDLVPGLGKVDSIVLWGNRWIVATTRGLVSTP
jgi:excisionase family DNA binding protein